MGRSPEKNWGEELFRDEGNCHGVRSRAFLGIWPVDVRKAFLFPTLRGLSVRALPFLAGVHSVYLY